MNETEPTERIEQQKRLRFERALEEFCHAWARYFDKKILPIDAQIWIRVAGHNNRPENPNRYLIDMSSMMSSEEPTQGFRAPKWWHRFFSFRPRDR